MPTKKTATRYFRWEGDACRMHTDGTGKETADLYRGGKGFVPISAGDLLFSAVAIGEAEYLTLVEQEDSLRPSPQAYSSNPATTIATVQHFRFHDEPCRVHTANNGDQTADMYRSGEGFSEIDPTNVLWGDSVALSPERYQGLIGLKDAFYKRQNGTLKRQPATAG